jgi:class 3 adenylate cyclase
MNNFLVLNEVSPLSVKIGIGYGECALLYVGGVFNRAEFFTVGSALTYALKSEGEATEGGQIIVSETAYKYVRDFYQSREIISDKGEKFYHVEMLTG